MGEMRKTTKEMCKKCAYGSCSGASNDVVCNYYLDTGQRRGCPVGMCDKYEDGKRTLQELIKKRKRKD